MQSTYTLVVVSFALTLSAAYLLIEGHEIALFVALYAAHLWASTYIKPEEVESDDPYDLLRYRPAIMR